MESKYPKSEPINDYGIPIFYDNRNGEMQISDTKQFFEGIPNISKEVWREQLIHIRGEISRDKSFLCGYCKKPIYIAGNFEPSSGQKRLHFHHYYNDDEQSCKFHETGRRHSEDEIRRMTFNGQQESKKHKELKRIICDSFLPLVGRENVLEEPTLRGKDGGWRRPDIFVKLPDKSIVFEVQLTYILLSAIIERNEVHRSNDRYVAWIFKDFGDGKGNTLDSERLSKLDIFLANNRNAFVLDDDAIDRTIETQKLYVKVFYRDYYLSEGKVCAKLGSAFVAFDSLTFDECRKMIYFFDSQNRYEECLSELKEEKCLIREETLRQPEILREKEVEERRLAEFERQKRETAEEERKRLEIEKKAEEYREYRKICKQLFTPTKLPQNDYVCLIRQLKEDRSKRQEFLKAIYSFTSQHRRDTQCFNIPLYSNSIKILTELYDDYASTDNPSVMTCLRRCWENISELTTQKNMPDLAIDLLFSPALSHLNYKYFGFISNPNHRLNEDQKNRIQEWIKAYHLNHKSAKDRYTHFFAWMVLLNNKVRQSNYMPLSEAHKLMRNNYKVIRAVISLAFGFLSGYNSKNYRCIDDVIENIEEHHAKYADLFLRYANKTKIYPYSRTVLKNLAQNTPQEHDLDVLMRILFEKSPKLMKKK